MLSGSPLAGQVPIVTDRPDQTESSQTVPRNTVQVETGWSVAGNLGVSDHAFLGTLVRLGVGPTAEARLGFGGLNRSAGGWEAGDFEVGFKQRLRDGEGASPTVALLAHVTITSGARLVPNARIAVSHELADRVSTGYNLGIEASRTSGPWLAEAIYTWTFGFGLTDRLGAFAEVFGSVGLSASGATGTSLDGGLTFGIAPRVQLDVAAGFGVAGVSDEWFLGAGLAVRLPR